MSETQIQPGGNRIPSGTRVATDQATIGGDGSEERPLHTLGAGGVDVSEDGSPVVTPATTINFAGEGVTVADGGSGVATVTIPGGSTGHVVIDTLNIPIGADQWPGGNMPEGTINDYSDPDMLTHGMLIIKGADNSGTALTGIDSTGFVAGDVLWMINLSQSGVDVGMVELFHEDTRSLPANRIQSPGAVPCYVNQYGGIMLIYGADSRWHPVTQGTKYNGYVRICALHLFPNVTMDPLTGQYDDWNPTPLTTSTTDMAYFGGTFNAKDYTVFRIPVDSGGASITGIRGDGSPDDGTGGDPWRQGMTKLLLNEGPGTLTLLNSHAGSLGQNRLQLPQGRDLILQPGEGCLLISPLGDPGSSSDGQWRAFGIAVSNEVFPNVITTGNAELAKLVLTPDVQPAALPAIPTITHDFDPGSTDCVIAVSTNVNGSIIGGLVGQVGNPIGELRELRNITAGPLILLDEDLGSTDGNRFRLPNAEAVVISQACSIFVQYADDDRWHVIGQASTLAAPSLPVSITPALLAATDVNDWDPVDATTGLNFEYAGWIRTTGSVGTILTGMRALKHGARRVIVNYLASYTIANGSGLSTAGNRFQCPNQHDFILTTGSAVEVLYDAISGVWVLLSARDGGT